MLPRSSTVMTALRDFPTRIAAALFLIVALTISMAQAGDTIVATVNGEPITAQDLEQRSKLLEAASPTHIAPSQQEILETLIDEKVSAPEARRWGFAPSDPRFKEMEKRFLPQMRSNALVEYR